MKKTFDCGHKGYGKLCHRCEEAARLVVRSQSESVASKKSQMTTEAERLRSVPKKVSEVVVTGS